MKLTVLESLNAGLISALQENSSVYLLGEDILDPYGGAFKVTKGCSSAYPERVIPTPISEAGLGGVVTGMALRGLRPVLEIMFGDFVTLLADQVINHLSKFRWMYNNSVEVPLVIRTPMGGRRGYGPTHSQTLEKIYLGVPGLTVVAPVNVTLNQKNTMPGELLKNIICNTHSPVLFVENKLQYLLPVYSAADLPEYEIKAQFDPSDAEKEYPIYSFSIKGAPEAKVTITAYGYMAELARQAQVKLAFEEEIFVELIVPTRLSPFGLQPLLDSARKTQKLLAVEEGSRTMGWGAEVAAEMAEKLPGIKIRRMGAMDTPVPAATSLEQSTLPQVEDIMDEIRKLERNG